MTIDPESSEFWDQSQVDAELKRVFDICNGCRRCYNLCPSFNDLFVRLDQDSIDGESELLGSADFKSVTDLCYQCKLCFNHCPYTPPHRWDLDFPRLMLRSKAVQVRREGRSLQDRFLGHVDTIGRWSSLFAPLVNWANRNRLHRWLLEKLIGLHRDRVLPRYSAQTFRRWYDEREPKGPESGKKKVALFYTCSVNFNEPEVGRACVQVLEKNGIEVQCPQQHCCGMPFLDGGDIEATQKNARMNVEALHTWVKKGYDVVAPGPTCSYMLKREYPMLLQDRATQEVAARTYDICEYLMARHGENELDTRFVRGVGRIAYQMPCHLRAQNIGYKSRDLMQLIPDTTVQVIEKCSAIDGTWGLKRQYFDLSLKVAEPLLREISESKPDLTVSDCSLAGLQMQQGTGIKPIHPVQVLQLAYGLQPERQA